MNRRMCIRIRGKSGALFGFPFAGDPKYIEGWQAEGFDVYEVLNTVPRWAVQLGLTRVWFRSQDVWQFLRVW